MKILVVGLGSMGKRRIRCLKSLGVVDITGFDPREDRRQETEMKYGVRTIGTLDATEISAADALILSVPPDLHAQYMRQATAARRHYFVEAGIINDGHETLYRESEQGGFVAAPSTTMTFHPGIKKITELIKAGRIGTICNFIYHFGQYLPDWHPYEKVEDFYVSNPLTGGAREIVPFELTWLVHCFGWPVCVTGTVGRTRVIKGAEKIDDTYVLTLHFPGHPATLVVDVVSRLATRSLTVVGTEAQLLWDWNTREVRVFDGEPKQWSTFSYDTSPAAPGYNANITEQMYVDEMKAFLDACDGGPAFPNHLIDDARVLKLLTNAELSSRDRRTVCFDE